jgi:hypothetical protein
MLNPCVVLRLRVAGGSTRAGTLLIETGYDEKAERERQCREIA